MLADGNSENLSSQFAQFVNREGLRDSAKNRRPTPLLPPTSVVEAQMDALQRNDWPEADAGARVAFIFSKPYGCEEIKIGQVI